ncbi:Glutamine--tRNA ligase [Seminavis robusta]|uniref:glutamine--tRNA ligase n=1 Tax=Seminavis robusta TaxID=568900 RepID=A0A9N8HVN1_9STRA|nr:Glutamine--tRNA ligase [Seminavis robusta]|eukprot:Sro1838_g300780.1 Glutamine--tRNA ligase (704) ;mRNA; r:2704-4912
MSEEAKAPAPAESEGEEDITRNALSARELAWAVNSPALLEEHKKINGAIIRTRFPPEPNGYLHVGHAKSMNMNFSLAFEKLKVPEADRRCIFRYDDTNPDAESEEYIDSLRRDLEWLGWKPERTTYSSENFQHLHDFAVQLIEKGLAYVCDMTKAEMEAQRELAYKRAAARSTGKDPDVEFPIPSPDILPGRNRDTPVQRNLDLFAKMKMGFFDEGTYTLRLKMDFESSNPNMYDLVAYRIKFTPHPHIGDGWCIYPAYDFTHGLCDSLEHIDYSICTLEFESRREPYYWILWALDVYRPAVYEMSRLNLQYTVLSKRRLIKLVDTNTVRGWNDPRMPTVSGLRRRGYTKEIINGFCNDVGATRAQNVVEISKLHQTARLQFSATSTRVMAALEPILIVITNFDEEAAKASTLTFEVENSPTDPSLGKHTVTLTSSIYIDSSDFRKVDSSDYFGLAPNKAVGVKYHGGNLVCDEVVEENGKIKELRCHLDNSEGRPKPKTYLSWVPSNGIRAEVRVYNELFTVPEPSDLWEDEINPESEIVYANAILDPSIKEVPGVDKGSVDQWTSNTIVQFERMGYFVVDLDTTFDIKTSEGKLVFNRTVSLKSEGPKAQKSAKKVAEDEARKAKQARDLELKEARMKIEPNDLFRLSEEYKGMYSKFDPETGIPTHDADGAELTKSAMKKLGKEKQKHVKALAAWKKNQK